MTRDHDKSMAEGLVKLVSAAVDEALKNDIRTTLPGYFLKFDPATQLAEVQIGIQRLDISDNTYTPPPIIKCPVCIYGASGGVVEVEISPGDELKISFSMRAIDGWRIQGGVAPLTSIQRYRQSDAFVELAPRSSKNVIAGYSNEGIKVRSLDGKRFVWLRNDESIEVVNDNGSLKLLASGVINANGATITTGGNVVTAAGTDLDAFKAAYDIHKHGGIQSGGSQTGVPV